MTDSTVITVEKRGSFRDELTDPLRTGARELVARAVEAELAQLLSAQAHRKLPDGRSAVVRNGYQPGAGDRDRDRFGAGADSRVRSRDGSGVAGIAQKLSQTSLRK